MALRTKIKTTGKITLTRELRSYIEEKLEKIEKLLSPRDTSALVEVELESMKNEGDGGPFRAEINLTALGKLLRAEAKRSSLHEAIDEAVLEARGELRRLTEKRRDKALRDARRYRSREKSA